MAQIELLPTMTDARINVHQGTTLKTGDTLPTFQGQLLDENGDPYDVTGMTPEFYMHDSDDNSVVSGASMNVLDETNGEVEYEWDSTDTSTAGLYNVEVVAVDDTTGSERTFPADGFVSVNINEDLQ